jgi:hypothetical protein
MTIFSFSRDVIILMNFIFILFYEKCRQLGLNPRPFKYKKFWEEPIAYFPSYDACHIENDASNNSSIVACVFLTAVTFLPSRWVATIGGFLPSRCLATIGGFLSIRCLATIRGFLTSRCLATMRGFLLSRCSATIMGLLSSRCLWTIGGIHIHTDTHTDSVIS